jgi:hypothetical protein
VVVQPTSQIPPTAGYKKQCAEYSYHCQPHIKATLITKIILVSRQQLLQADSGQRAPDINHLR